MARTPEYPVDKIFIERWSPRAMSGEKISREELMTLFEAAKWAPSSYNNQPWRFVYVMRDSPKWNQFMDFLVDGNKPWNKNAAALVVLISKKTFDHNSKPYSSYSAEAGMAYENLALQASMKKLVVHGMGGFFADKVKSVLKIPDDYAIEFMFCVGRHGDKSVLSADYQKIEKPSDRKKLSEIAFEEEFKV